MKYLGNLCYQNRASFMQAQTQLLIQDLAQLARNEEFDFQFVYRFEKSRGLTQHSDIHMINAL